MITDSASPGPIFHNAERVVLLQRSKRKCDRHKIHVQMTLPNDDKFDSLERVLSNRNIMSEEITNS